MTESVVLADVFTPPLSGASLSLGAGMWVVLGTPADGTAILIELLAGSARPRRGSVQVQGRDPYRDPALRAAIAAVLAEEPDWGIPTESMLRDALGSEDAAKAALQRLGLGNERRCAPKARRAVQFEIAVARPQPSLVAIFEPLSGMTPLDRARNRHALQQLARTAPVVCATASIQDARALGGTTLLLDRGRFVRAPGPPLTRELAPAPSCAFVVRAEGVDRLAAALATEPSVSGVELDRDALPDQAHISGKDADAVSFAILRAARSSGATLRSLELTSPSLDETRGATAALWRAAYERAYAATRPPTAPAPPPAPPTTPQAGEEPS